MSPEMTLLVLFTVATAGGHRHALIKVPYTVALVLAGLRPWRDAISSPGSTSQRICSTPSSCPVSSSKRHYHLEYAELRANARAILALAVPGVLVAIGATATLLVKTSHIERLAAGFGWPHALVFAAVIAATDPIPSSPSSRASARRSAWASSSKGRASSRRDRGRPLHHRLRRSDGGGMSVGAGASRS